MCEVRASDKRITCDEEFSDSEDEGEGGRRHQESFKHKRIRLDDKTAPTDKSLHFSLHSFRSKLVVLLSIVDLLWIIVCPAADIVPV